MVLTQKDMDIARAIVLSLQQHKQMNSAYTEGPIHVYIHVHQTNQQT